MQQQQLNSKVEFLGLNGNNLAQLPTRFVFANKNDKIWNGDEQKW